MTKEEALNKFKDAKEDMERRKKNYLGEAPFEDEIEMCKIAIAAIEKDISLELPITEIFKKENALEIINQEIIYLKENTEFFVFKDLIDALSTSAAALKNEIKYGRD